MQAYDQNATFEGAFKTLEGFEGLLDRAVVSSDVRLRASALLTTLSLDLRKVILSVIL